MTGKQRMCLMDIGVDVDETLDRFTDDEDLYLECLSRFSIDADIKELLDAIETNDAKECFEKAHSIKGVASNLGFTDLHKDIAILTDVFRAGSMAYDPLNLSAVVDDYNLVLEAIEKVVR